MIHVDQLVMIASEVDSAQSQAGWSQHCSTAHQTLHGDFHLYRAPQPQPTPQHWCPHTSSVHILLLSIYNIVVCQYVVCSVYYTDIKCRLYVNCTHIITIFLSCSVIDILLDVHSGKDWPHALLAHVPRRKGFQLKPVADNNDDLDTITNSANSHYIIKDRG